MPSRFATFIVSISLFPILAAATSIQHKTCNISGDPDVYGPGVRYGFYLQWAAITLFLFACPEKANIARTASTLSVLSVYINTFRNFQKRSVIGIEWALLWYLTSALLLYNLPVSKKGAQKSGGSLSAMLLIFSMYYMASPYVFFAALEYGKQPGCDLKVFLFTPISIYAKGFWMTMKVFSMGGAILAGPLFFIGALAALVGWFRGWGDSEVENYQEPRNIRSVILGTMAIGGGATAIAFTEMTIKINHITFPGTSFEDSGQLISLLIGGFTLVSAAFSAMR
ncbi:hypothetical protein P154DRAFT_261877 [Amniculicola lignicola CBS 123094]|uniref:Uncharacterized protein n=1 Tax=Amniculicola lignicola CBS 123094 TaxID=1392246 RepID=A0A6A5WBW2_9PLEO|nr:hypothetical protein P154DRAFT_261877 [Amniculicola lignicola CBS 123094]